jgi:predicted DNA-binding transcriptional regulator AlpA
MPGNKHNTTSYRLLSKKQLLEIVPLSYPTIWKLMRAGKFPRGLVISQSQGRATRACWRAAEVYAWIENLPRQQLLGDETDKDLG